MSAGQRLLQRWAFRLLKEEELMRAQVSKAGVKATAEQLAHELRNDGDTISVHLLVPGWDLHGCATPLSLE